MEGRKEEKGATAIRKNIFYLFINRKMFRNDFHRDDNNKQQPDSKLQAVFSKLTGVFPRAGDLGGNGVSNKTMSSDIIESVLTDTPIPIPQRK